MRESSDRPGKGPRTTLSNRWERGGLAGLLVGPHYVVKDDPVQAAVTSHWLGATAVAGLSRARDPGLGRVHLRRTALLEVELRQLGGTKSQMPRTGCRAPPHPIYVCRIA